MAVYDVKAKQLTVKHTARRHLSKYSKEDVTFTKQGVSQNKGALLLLRLVETTRWNIYSLSGVAVSAAPSKKSD